MILGDITQSLCTVVTVAIEHGIEVFNGANRSAGPVVPAIVEFDFSTIDALGVPAIEEPGVPFETIGDGATVDTVDPDVFIAVDVIVGGTNVVSADISEVTGTVTTGVGIGGSFVGDKCLDGEPQPAGLPCGGGVTDPHPYPS